MCLINFVHLISSLPNQKRMLWNLRCVKFLQPSPGKPTIYPFHITRDFFSHPEQCIIHAYLMMGIRRASWSKTMGGTHTLTRFLPWLHPTTLLRKQTRTFQVFFFVPKKEDKENFICNILLGKQLKKTLSIYEKDLTSFKVQWGREGGTFSDTLGLDFEWAQLGKFILIEYFSASWGQQGDIVLIF